MTGILNMPWIGRDLEVVKSFDPTYHGRRGIIVEETQRTLIISENGRNICLPKQEIDFRLDCDDIIIKGSFVLQRSEDRIHRKYRS
ncbi:MAG: hypothetical protein CMB56_000125 [Methanobacteriota archaeon]|nr:MAG: hypothetical protein CMB56_000125 [Euryarchaeota archaeon]|tara:strand:+ start:4468 stop:4725 length:258 start_codon:yes stop_codon:yes gene_type:complete